MQVEITNTGDLLSPQGELIQPGWSRQPLLDCNLEMAAFYPRGLRFLQFIRIKKWDYYAVFTPHRFFSATIADLGYAGNIFVYTIEYQTNLLHEEGLVIPLGRGIQLPRNTIGQSRYKSDNVGLNFSSTPECTHLSVSWPTFDNGRGIFSEIDFHRNPEQESMNIVTPIGRKRFYYNHKINCLPAEGWLECGGVRELLAPNTSMGSLDWGRGVWEYSSFWKWASASGRLPDGRSIGLNLGGGFGDTRKATENCIILDNRIHKLDEIDIKYNPQDYFKPWIFTDTQSRLEIVFTPFKERLAKTNLLIINSEVHQMFGHYKGWVTTDDGEIIQIDGLIGFAEDHRARW